MRKIVSHIVFSFNANMHAACHRVAIIVPLKIFDNCRKNTSADFFKSPHSAGASQLARTITVQEQVHLNLNLACNTFDSVACGFL